MSMTNKSKYIKTDATIYFLLTFGWSIIFWAASYFSGAQDPSTSILYYVGGAGPFIVAILFVFFKETKSIRRDFWIRIFNPGQITNRWLFFALLLHPIIIGLAFVTDNILGGPLPIINQQIKSLPALMGLILSVFVLGPLPEEIGWRGFALDSLLSRTTALKASLIVGSIWALWHVPLFYIPGTFHAAIGPFSLRFWVFLLSNVPLSILITWIYVNTRRSTLSAALVHFSGNFIGALFIKTDQAAVLEVIILTIAAVIIVLKWGSKTLTESEVRNEQID